MVNFAVLSFRSSASFQCAVLCCAVHVINKTFALESGITLYVTLFELHTLVNIFECGCELIDDCFTTVVISTPCGQLD